MPDDAREPCRWCGLLHDKLCPYVKAIEFSPDSPLTVTRVEFLTPLDYPRAAGVDEEPETPYPKMGPGKTPGG